MAHFYFFFSLLSFLLTPKKRAKGLGQMSLATENRAAPANAANAMNASNPLVEFD